MNSAGKIGLPLILALLICLVLSFEKIYAAKTDTLYLLNGDRITGEIKKFEYGILVFKTDGMGTLSVEFDEISTFYSAAYYDIRLFGGFRYFGSFDKAKIPQAVNIVVTNDTLIKPLIEIVEIIPLKRAFWQRIDGGADLGYSYKKSTTLSELNYSFNAEYRYEKNDYQLNTSTILTEQGGQARSSKQDYTFTYRRLFSGKSYFGGYTGVQSNTEQGIDVRLLVGGGLGNNFFQTNLHRLQGTLGILVTNETSISGDENNNIEGLVQLNYKIFRFNIPKVDLSSSMNLYPSFNIKNRYRFEYDIKGKVELIKDLYFSISLYYYYDNKPLDPNAAKDDYGINTAVGISF